MNSLGEALTWGLEVLGRSANRSARSEVEQVLMHLLRCQRMDLYLKAGLFDHLDLGVFEQLITQRAKRVPLQYLLGESYFWCWEFSVKPGVFIPRPETELLVEQSVRLFKNQTRNGEMPRRSPPRFLADEDGQQGTPGLPGGLHLMDLGTGCGILAVTLTKLLSHCKISAVEISPTALEVAKENASRHGVDQFIQFIHDDWKQVLDNPPDQVEGIVANPPYIPSGEIDRLDFQVQMEPRQALDGGAEGLDCIQFLLSQSRRVLKEGGYLVLEIGDGQIERVREIAQREKWSRYGSIKDFNGVERVFWVRK